METTADILPITLEQARKLGLVSEQEGPPYTEAIDQGDFFLVKVRMWKDDVKYGISIRVPKHRLQVVGEGETYPLLERWQLPDDEEK